MAKRLTVMISDEIYEELLAIKGEDETLTIMDLVRAALRLMVWYRRQRRDGFTICARKDDGEKEIVREVLIHGL